jgi:hypothetical protein
MQIGSCVPVNLRLPIIDKRNMQARRSRSPDSEVAIETSSTLGGHGEYSNQERLPLGHQRPTCAGGSFGAQ